MTTLESMEDFNKLFLNPKMDGQKFKIAGVETILVFPPHTMLYLEAYYE